MFDCAGAGIILKCLGAVSVSEHELNKVMPHTAASEQIKEILFI